MNPDLNYILSWLKYYFISLMLSLELTEPQIIPVDCWLQGIVKAQGPTDQPRVNYQRSSRKIA
jgi:hypothetical protein